MTTMRTSPHTAVHDARRQLGLPTGEVIPLRNHATDVYLLPDQHIVARVRPLARADETIQTWALLRWLHDHGFPAAQPVGEPVQEPESGYIVTFWVHYPQPPAPPPASALGALLRELHALPDPPVKLPDYQPLVNLTDTLARSTTLTESRRRWLAAAAEETVHAYRSLGPSPLGHGLIHGDAYPGNTLWDDGLVRLGDWDEAATGPRELDLANTIQGAHRFGRSEQEINAFTRAYSHDPRTWPGLQILIGMRDLHTLGSFIRRADRGDTQAALELDHRLHTLQTGRRTVRWGIH
ncbi:phosphotransferase enzyme family protein [Streptomyces sp. NPDC059816]|uniref:phosphotransferase enzyme family protein n=1 Tax=Streptomyces sp. NPDC059816 TaxID=3346960 RepID=UPI0036632686